MKMLKRIISSVLTVSLLLPVFANLAYAEDEQSTKSISNDYMEFSVNEDTGFFSIYTKEGHPQKKNDNDMSLLYDGESIETSFTTVRIDGKDYIFGQDYGLFGMTSKRGESTVDVVNNIISTVWTIKEDITITQKAQLSRTDNTMNTGNVMLSYEIDNQSKEKHSVGIRVMFDNALGEIDAPVTMVQKEISPISKETEFFENGRDPGAYVRYLDNYEQPSKEAFITFDGIDNPDPDSMTVGHWYHLASTKWDYEADKDFSFDTGFNTFGTADTATALYWNATDCEPGEKINKTVTYGIGEFTEGYTDSKFNISLDLEGTLELDDTGKKYKEDIIIAHINVYNNVDGSVDLKNAKLSLACDNGLNFLMGSEDSDDFFEGTAFVKELGFIAAGTMETYTIQLRADVPDELKSLKVSATVQGNSEDNVVSASQYVIAPAKKGDKATISIEKIEADTYHISGNRVMKAFGKIPKDLLADETKWKATFVNKDYPEIRYDIENINITSDSEMTITHNSDMVEGTYNIEIAFFEDYKDIIADKYLSTASISIVNDPSLAANEYSMVCVYRTGSGLATNYSLVSMRSEQELAAMQEKIAQANKTANGSVAELPLILRGTFTPEKDNAGNIIGYAAVDDFSLNGIVYGEKNSTIEYVNYRNNGEAVWDGVILNGKDKVKCNNMLLMDCDWKIEIENNVFYSLASQNICIEATGVISYLINVVGGFFNPKLGALGKNAEYGDYISFGGTLTLSGYTGKETPKQKIDEKNGAIHLGDTPENLKMNRLNVYASAEITDVMFNKDGFVGINTTFEIGIAASNILKTARKDVYMLKLHIDTINGFYGGKITFGIKGITISIALEFLAKKDKDGNFVFVADDMELTGIVSPANPAPIAPPVVSLVQLGASIKDLSSLVDALESPTSQEMVEAISSTTFEIVGTVGLLVVQALVCTGVFTFGVNHWSISVTGSVPAVPSISSTLYISFQAKYPVSDSEGNDVSPGKYTLVVSMKSNVFGILALGGTFSYNHLDSITVNDVKKDSSDYAGFTVYGTLSVPTMVPLFGGMEIFGVTGTIDTLGIKAIAEIMGCELGVTYGWGDDDVVWIYSDEETGEKLGINNMRYLPVEVTTDDKVSLFSTGFGTDISANITTYSGSNNLIAVKYNGTTPDIDDLSLDIDGKNYPLTEATQAGNYSDGNCIIMPDNGEGGKIIIGINDDYNGKRTYKLTAKNAGIRMSAVEAGGFERNVKAKSATVNQDGTITVKADKSLKNSNVQVFYTNSKTTYDDIITENYIDEDGKKQVHVYKMVDGQKVDFDEKLMADVVEYSVYNETITEDKNEITITPQAGAEAESGEYHVMAVVTSPYNKITRAYADTDVSYTNENEPVGVADAVLTDIGDETLELNITDAENADYEGYFVSIYNETDGEYEYRDDYFKKDSIITFDVESGKKYHAEVETMRTYGDNLMACSADKITNSVTVHTPEKVNASISLTNETVSGNYPDLDGEIRQVNYISGRVASFTAHADEAVKGCFVVDDMETTLTEEKQQDFTYSGEFDEGVHTVAFKAVNDNGDSTITDYISFAVKEDTPAIMLENSIVKVTDGKITLKGYCNNTEKLSFMGKEYTPNTDGSFQITENVESERFAQRYQLSATGYSGLQSVSSVIAINGEFKPVDRVDILADGESVESITLEPGQTAQLSVLGYSGEEERNVDDTVALSVVSGNNVVTVDADNQLKVLSSGTAYVKTVYNLGSYIANDMTSDFKLEDMIEVNVKKKSPDVITSIPDGASVKKGTKLTLSADGDIYYTTDGSEPTRESTLYTGPISLTKDVTIKAVCFKEGYIDGDVMTVSYKVKPSSSSSSSSSGSEVNPTAAPQTSGENNAVITATESGKKVEYGSPIELKINEPGKIYYTTDGTTPNKNSMEYTKPIILTEDTVIKAVVWQEGDVYSQIYTFDYELDGYMIKLRDDMEKSMLISGYEDGTFRPDSSITRAETASLLRRSSEMYGYYINDDVFSDVEMWAKQDINELAAAEVISGYGDGTFRPDNAVTRAEFVTMLMRIIGENGDTSAFADVNGHWAEKYIDKAGEYGYINGYEDGTFRPDNNITRAEAVTIMSKVFGFAPDGTVSRFGDVTNSHWAFGYIAD